MIKYGDKQHFRGLEDDPELNYTLITLATDNGDNEIVLNDHYDQVIIENKWFDEESFFKDAVKEKEDESSASY